MIAPSILGRTGNSSALYSKVTDLLYTSGIPAHINGFQYIRDAVMIIASIDGSYCITKDIYPQIAARYHSSPSRIERSIRHAIELAWDRNCYFSLSRTTGAVLHCPDSRPPNGEFIALIYELATHTQSVHKQPL